MPSISIIAKERSIDFPIFVRLFNRVKNHFTEAVRGKSEKMWEREGQLISPGNCFEHDKS